jgi:hypothetical protein
MVQRPCKNKRRGTDKKLKKDVHYRYVEIFNSLTYFSLYLLHSVRAVFFWIHSNISTRVEFDITVKLQIPPAIIITICVLTVTGNVLTLVLETDVDLLNSFFMSVNIINGTETL